MTLAQSLTAIIIFWAIIGGLGASLLLPAMQSLIHGNFEGAAQKQGLRPGRRRGRDRRRGRAAARRLHHHVPVVARRLPARGRRHRGRAVRHQARPRRAVHRAPGGRRRRRGPLGRGHGRHRAGHPGLAGGRRVGRARSWWSAPSRWSALVWWLVRRKRQGKPTLLDPDLFQSKIFRFGISEQMLQQIALGRHDDRAADLPADGARVQRACRPACRSPRCRSACSPSRSLAGKRAGSRRPSSLIRLGFALLTIGLVVLRPDRAPRRLRLVPRASR